MSSTNRGAERREADFYPTPREAFDGVLSLLPKGVSYWEPCCGDGRLVRWLREAGHEAFGADLFPQPEWPCAKVDFLRDETEREFIITNPPFSLALPCVQRAIANAPEVMMLLRINFLGSQKRQEWLRDNEPRALFVLSQRPSFAGGGTDSCEYAWFYWGSRYWGIHHP